jgi:adenylate cyclase
MFIDLKASTTIAEQVGHYKFSQMIQDCFKDISVVQTYRAEVYQYVGDEVVLTWSPHDGLMRNNYVHAFFAFKNVLESKRRYYEARYGIFPEFKAGAHIGECTITEVGELKREICYHGDTLNTTGRIEKLCNDYEADLLISEDLEIETDKLIYFNKEEVGTFELRGKEEKVKLFKITRHGS